MDHRSRLSATSATASAASAASSGLEVFESFQLLGDGVDRFAPVASAGPAATAA